MILYIMFQFHKGSIKTLIPSRWSISINSFQFHKGSIKTHNKGNEGITVDAFQFHKGSIKTPPASEPRGRSKSVSIP